MPVDEPILALLSVAVLANLVITVAVVVALVRRRPAPVPRPALADAGPVSTEGGLIGRPEFDLFHGFPSGARDRVVRIVAWTFLIAATAIVTLSGLWPDTQPYILVVLAMAGLFVVIVHDLLPSEALGSGKAIVEGSAGLTVASLLVLLTGQVASPFVVTYALIVAGGAPLHPAPPTRPRGQGGQRPHVSPAAAGGEVGRLDVVVAKGARRRSRARDDRPFPARRRTAGKVHPAVAAAENISPDQGRHAQ